MNKKIIKILFIIYCICLFFILFLYGARTGNQFHLKVFSKEHFEMVNIIPFKTIISIFERLSNNTINTDIVVTNIVSNLLLFLPMGMALPVLFKNKFNSFWKTIISIIVLIVIVEIIQFLTFRGSADIDDLILNTLGASLGYALVHLNGVKKLLKIEE